jgi:hypothetical protein
MTQKHSAVYNDLFQAVQMDDDAKRVFLAMSREEQLLAILGMQSFVRSEVATVKKDIIDVRQDLNEFKKETRSYRVHRERQEKKMFGGEEGDDEMSTTQKIAKEIAKALSQRFDFWIWFRDKVMPAVVTAITLGILYLVFGGKLP